MVTAAIGFALLLASGAESPSVQMAAARALGAQAAKEYLAGRYEDAARNLTKAHDLFPAPILLYNLGQCERARGHLDDAIADYRGYLAAEPTGRNASSARSKLQEALAAKARPVPGLAEEDPDASPPTAAAHLKAPAPPRPRRVPDALVVEELWPDEPAPRSHALTWSLGGASLVVGAVAIFGAVQVADFQSEASHAEQHPGTLTYAQAQGRQSAVGVWLPLSIVLGGVAVAGVVTSAIVW